MYEKNLTLSKWSTRSWSSGNARVFQKKLMQQNENGPVFRFLDGPITANNPMGVHHAWGRSIKDIILRYKGMTGHACHYRNGFDGQGLWVEVEVEKGTGLFRQARYRGLRHGQIYAPLR